MGRKNCVFAWWVGSGRAALAAAAAVIATALPASWQTAVAQVAASGTASGAEVGGALEEIVVTARRRSESLQQVPIAVSAIDQAALQRQDVRTLSDLQLLVPSAYVSGYSSACAVRASPG
jgi:iron complex outermembrane receptor protein